ncbi:hypothetical protein TNCV_820711 [Trichonephila clavipes]|nr:hypothetical protein TNCV_820711 [Trichonephila clavipes]
MPSEQREVSPKTVRTPEHVERVCVSIQTDLLEDVTLNIYRDMWFQLDGWPAHYESPSRSYIAVVLESCTRVIGDDTQFSGQSDLEQRSRSSTRVFLLTKRHCQLLYSRHGNIETGPRISVVWSDFSLITVMIVSRWVLGTSEHALSPERSNFSHSGHDCLHSTGHG